MRYELSDYEWTTIKPMLPNKPRGVRRVNDRRVLNGAFWVLRLAAPRRDHRDLIAPGGLGVRSAAAPSTTGASGSWRPTTPTR
jgi:transposase